ncbi:DUF317 domain-containing protein [Streptomyces sp. NPDC059373]
MPTVNDEPAGVFYVRPRYLAGSTWTGDPALQPFYDQGWSLHYDARGNLHVNAPDQRVRISYLPEGDDDTLWKVAAHRAPSAPPWWVAEFNDATPTEIVAGLTTALAEDYRSGTQRFLDGSTNPADGYEPLAAASWNRMDLGLYDRYRIFTAPDDLAYLTLYDRYLRPLTEPADEQERWTFSGGPEGWRSLWYGTFTSRTPAHLVAATAAAIVDPAPVVREGWEIPEQCRDLVHLTPFLPPQPPVPTPLDVRRTAVAQAVERATRTRHANPRALAALARTTGPLPPNGARPAATPSDQRPSPAAIPRPGLRP